MKFALVSSLVLTGASGYQLQTVQTGSSITVAQCLLKKRTCDGCNANKLREELGSELVKARGMTQAELDQLKGTHGNSEALGDELTSRCHHLADLSVCLLQKTKKTFLQLQGMSTTEHRTALIKELITARSRPPPLGAYHGQELIKAMTDEQLQQKSDGDLARLCYLIDYSHITDPSIGLATVEICAGCHNRTWAFCGVQPHTCSDMLEELLCGKQALCDENISPGRHRRRRGGSRNPTVCECDNGTPDYTQYCENSEQMCETCQHPFKAGYDEVYQIVCKQR